MSEVAGCYPRLKEFYAAAQEETYERQGGVAYDVSGALEGLKSANNSASSLEAALTAEPEVAIIAEYKRRTPDSTEDTTAATVTGMVQQYALGGAAALSIVTQHRHFGGHMQDIAVAHKTSSLPILRKDFLSTPNQLHEAKIYGAAAVLLITGGLSNVQLRELMREADQIELECLVEVHDEADLQRALAAEPRMIGFNNRDLDAQSVDLARAERLVSQAPADVVTVAESGFDIRDEDHARRLQCFGFDGALVGRSLLRDPHPARALIDYRAAMRAD